MNMKSSVPKWVCIYRPESVIQSFWHFRVCKRSVFVSKSLYNWYFSLFNNTNTPHSRVQEVTCCKIAFFSNSTNGFISSSLASIGCQMDPNLNLFYTKKEFGTFKKNKNCFSNSANISDIYLKTPLVQVATNHANENQKKCGVF